MTAKTAFKDEVANHFPTTFMRRRHQGTADLNSRLHSYLLALEKRERNKLAGTSNVGGFHGDTKLLSGTDGAIVELRQMIFDGVLAYVGALINNECAARRRIQICGCGAGASSCARVTTITSTCIPSPTYPVSIIPVVSTADSYGGFS